MSPDDDRFDYQTEDPWPCCAYYLSLRIRYVRSQAYARQAW